jgi:hypothetical protein
MTRNKAQKQAIRARMTKTGEHYTTARHHLLDLHHASPSDAAAGPANDTAASPVASEDVVSEEPASPPTANETLLPPRVAEPGVSDAAVQRATGKTWDEWFALLDAWDGTSHSHPEIARHVYEVYDIDGWWAQNVTVGYERARGMRALHERPDGFSMNASKTVPVPIERLFAAFLAADERAHWLDGIELRERTSQLNKSARFDVLPGNGRLAAYFTAKDGGKSSVALQMERLPSADEVERWKTIWKTQLSRLAAYVAG